MQMAHSKLATLILGSLLLKQQWEAIWEWEQKMKKRLSTFKLEPLTERMSVPPFTFDLLTSIKIKYIHDGSLSQSSCITAQQLS